MYSRKSPQFFENKFNGIILLDNKHRFKDDPEYAKVSKRFWSGKLSENDRNTINKRVVSKTALQMNC